MALAARGALLRQEGLAANHLACLHLGAKNIRRERRRARNRSDRLLALLDAIHDAALVGLKEHDRLVMAKSQMERNSAIAAPAPNCPTWSNSCCRGHLSREA
ncbi:DUF1612 domain-containing protein [Mesorhizobium sp. M0768]|uniref:DUF1612 domain-containing protein n=1 Tax=Mesorhizobium sp. M0768 TaxID=2956996 RepID=UPI003336F23A